MLRLGVLLCDSLDPPHRDVRGDYDTLFTRLLSRDDVEVVHYRAHRGELPTSTTECDAWLVPGSRASVYDEVDWIVDLRRLTARLLEAEQPLLGVCFGHQLIAQELGTPVERSDDGWNVGAIDYHLTKPPPGPSAARSFTLIASHQDQVTALPTGADLFATTETCPIAGFTLGSRVLTVQAHPEFEPELAASLYRARVDLIGADPIANALASLNTELDRHLVADWLLDVARDS